MICMNELMKTKFVDEKSEIHNLAKMIADDTKLVKDCMVYDKNQEINETKINFDRIMMMYGDRTGYEVACNEIRFEKEILSKSQILSFLVELDMELATKFARKVAIYIEEIDDVLELRFHSLRENEPLWLSDDLNSYDTPIICYIS